MMTLPPHRTTAGFLGVFSRSPDARIRGGSRHRPGDLPKWIRDLAVSLNGRKGDDRSRGPMAQAGSLPEGRRGKAACTPPVFPERRSLCFDYRPQGVERPLVDYAAESFTLMTAIRAVPSVRRLLSIDFDFLFAKALWWMLGRVPATRASTGGRWAWSGTGDLHIRCRPSRPSSGPSTSGGERVL